VTTLETVAYVLQRLPEALLVVGLLVGCCCAIGAVLGTLDALSERRVGR
jgi:hypothetical protein